MLLGKRLRAPISRTTSLSDLNLPAGESQPSDHSQLMTVDENRQDHDGLLNQRLLAIVSRNDFLRSCTLCKSQLVPRRDIYMYRGDRAFCSLECRQHQITLDQRKEKVRLAATVTGSAEG